MITILFAPDGGGKSYYQLRLVVKALRETKRNICTNLALNLPDLAAYLEKQYPSENCNPAGRIRLLTDAETLEFWKYRGPLVWNLKTDYDLVETVAENGVLYIIDEAGQAGFSAAGWAQKDSQGAHDRTVSRGARVLWYLEQHRKFSDDVVASTNGRFPTGIAKPFRDKARDFVRMRNGRQRKMGVFKAAGKFTATHFTAEPNNDIEPWKEESFPFDLELMKCYDTARGVGVTGSAADKGAKVTGIHVYWVWPFAIGLGSLCILVPWVAAKTVGSHVQGAGKQLNKVVDAGTSAFGEVRGTAIKPVAEPQPLDIGAVYAGESVQHGQLYVYIPDDQEWAAVVKRAGSAVVLADGRRARREGAAAREERKAKLIEESRAGAKNPESVSKVAQ